MIAARFVTAATDGSARAGHVHTSRGTFPTPCFMPVGTRGAVRLLSAEDLEALGAHVVLGNTYHLMLRPGAQLIAEMGGLHRFSGWSGHMLTDSGGYQVFSLSPQVDDEGVSFRSTYDGSMHRLTPEAAVEVQELLGADIQMALDVCPPLPSPDEVIRLAMARTLSWAVRARDTHRRADQCLFGIVQGGVHSQWRAEHATALVALDFDGYGIGGLSVGEPRHEMLPALAATTACLPEDRPRYLMGVGDPVSIVEAVALGVDMFDCVLPTRLARHGSALTTGGRLGLKAARFARDEAPIDPTCSCPVCGRWSRAYLRHLFVVGELTGPRLVSLHNLWWLFRFVDGIRQAVLNGTLDEMRVAVGDAWGEPSLR
jgi:queuine tRNA-ribosyltransferase